MVFSIAASTAQNLAADAFPGRHAAERVHPWRPAKFAIAEWEQPCLSDIARRDSAPDR